VTAASFWWTGTRECRDHRPNMSKKAGPKRIDPETFRPTVFTAQGSDMSFLICRRRWLRGNSVLGGLDKTAISSEHFTWPVAIQIAPTIEVLTGFQVRELNWEASRPEEHGISERCAKAALSEAWHGVKATLDLGTMEVHISSRTVEWGAHKNGVRIRNLITALFWDRWNRDGLAIEARVAVLTDSGFPCTRRQLEKFVGDRGL
jgi:hypothetical protein